MRLRQYETNRYGMSTHFTEQISCLVIYQNGDDGKKGNWCVRGMSYCRLLRLLKDDLKQKTNSPVAEFCDVVISLHHDYRNVL